MINVSWEDMAHAAPETMVQVVSCFQIHFSRKNRHVALLKLNNARNKDLYDIGNE